MIWARTVFKSVSSDRQYHAARREHAYRLRGAGLTLRETAARLDVSREQVRHMVFKYTKYERPK